MLEKDQREKIQSCLRLLQLDQDEEIWEKAAAEFAGDYWRMPPVVYQNARDLQSTHRQLRDMQRNLEDVLRQCGGHKEDLRRYRASLIVALENFLLTDGSE